MWKSDLEIPPLKKIIIWGWKIPEQNERLCNIYKYVKDVCQEDGARLFSLTSSDRTRGSGCKLGHRRFHLTMRKKNFTERITEHWNRLPERWWISFSGDIQKPPRCVPVWPHLGFPVPARGLDLMTFQGPFPSNPWHIRAETMQFQKLNV